MRLTPAVVGLVGILLVASCDDVVSLAPKASTKSVPPVAGQIVGVLPIPTPTPRPSPTPTPTPTPTLAPLPDKPAQAFTPAPVVNQPVVATGSGAP